MAATTGTQAVARADDRSARPNGTTGGRFGLSTSAAVGLLLTFLGFVGTARTSGDNSLLTHIATGRLILDTGGVPEVDPYSSTALGDPWVVQSWLPSMLYAVIERLVGLGGIRALHALLSAAVVAGTWRLTRPAGQLVARVGLTMAPLGLGFEFWSHRPLMFGLVALVVLLLVVQGELPLWTLVPTLWVWVNSHGSFLFAFAVVGALAIGAILDSRSSSSPSSVLSSSSPDGHGFGVVVAGRRRSAGPAGDYGDHSRCPH